MAILDLERAEKRLAKVIKAEIVDGKLNYHGHRVFMFHDGSCWIESPLYGTIMFAQYESLEYHFHFYIPLWKLI